MQDFLYISAQCAERVKTGNPVIMLNVTDATQQIDENPPVDILSAAAFIMQVQKQSGEIPWSRGGKTDLWDHVESAMGLTVAGFTGPAQNAYEWAARTQLPDGSWWSYYRDGRPIEGAYKDTNMTAYIAVGVLHYFLSTGDLDFLQRLWPTVEKATEYTIRMQAPEGQVYWARSARGNIEKRALLTGSSSVLLSLRAASRTADILGISRPEWQQAAARLYLAICDRPHLFDPTKSRFSMDWYYPVLCGAVTGDDAEKRIRTKWELFTIPGWGVRCVSDQPWLTMAETAELILALVAMGWRETARTVYGWLRDKHYGDGAFWTGVTYPDRIIYTDEKTTWTSAAVLLATDALYRLTPGRRIFSHDFRS